MFTDKKEQDKRGEQEKDGSTESAKTEIEGIKTMVEQEKVLLVNMWREFEKRMEEASVQRKKMKEDLKDTIKSFVWSSKVSTAITQGPKGAHSTFCDPVSEANAKIRTRKGGF